MSNYIFFTQDKRTLVKKRNGLKLKHVKEYLVGTTKQIFNYAIRVSDPQTGVNLDEVILVRQPTRLCFDMEIKKKIPMRYLLR
jgi:hypothetical protein